MNSYSVWLNVLTMLRRPILWMLPILLMAGAAQATTFNFNGGNVVPICPLSGNTYTCASLPNSADTDVVIIASGYTVVVNSSVSFSYNQSLQMSGTATLQSSSLTVADVNPANLKITGGVLKASSTFSAGNQAQTIVADISAATINIGTGSTTKITGTLTATNQITLASNVSIIGNVTAPTVLMKASNTSVKGDISAATSLTIESNNAVNGKITGGALTMNDGGVVINGSVTMTGDISMGSSDVINGDVVAHNVTTKSSGTSINGNAAVNAIYLDWSTSVTKTITCTGAPANAATCSCVTKADANYKPTCGAAAPTGADHILITHNGQGLTCQAQPVTLRACGDASCSTTYTGDSTVTLTPGGGAITFNGTANASVRQSVAGAATLSAGSGTVCQNSAANNNSCAMLFSDSGLQLSTTDHVSMSGATLTIQARKTGPNNGSCVPLVQNTTAKISFSCGYMNPASGGKSLSLGSASLACNGGATPIDVVFDNTGLGTVALQYPDVGLVSVNASYTSANLGASGSTSFTAAPQSFTIVATPDPSITINASAFAHASDPFRLTVTAVNAQGNATPNFGKESAPESFIISQTLKLPSDGVSGTSSQGKFQAINGGIGKSMTDATGLWVFGETGTITLSAKLANSSSYYLGKTINGFKTVGTQDLRFVPHHFDTVLLLTAPIIPMDCTKVGGYGNPCTPSNTAGSFVYSRQQFPMQVKVYKDATNLSENYRLRTLNSTDTDDVARTVTLSLAQSAGGAPIKPIDPKVGFVFAHGIGSLTNTMPSAQFNTEPSLPTTVLLRVTDTDAITSQSTGAVEASLTVVSGKMQIGTAYGPASSNMPVEASAMYWSSASGGAWLFNPLFMPQSPAQGAATTVDASDGSFSNCSGGINCNALSLVKNTFQFKYGKATFSVVAPKASGTVKVGLKQDSTLTPTPFMNANFPYLPIIDGGTLTFGVSRAGPVIYTREVYN